MRGDQSKRLTVLSDAERVALYGLPYFDDFGLLGAVERKIHLSGQFK